MKTRGFFRWDDGVLGCGWVKLGLGWVVAILVSSLLVVGCWVGDQVGWFVISLDHYFPLMYMPFNKLKVAYPP